jgi:hypothetical protein
MTARSWIDEGEPQRFPMGIGIHESSLSDCLIVAMMA